MFGSLFKADRRWEEHLSSEGTRTKNCKKRKGVQNQTKERKLYVKTAPSYLHLHVTTHKGKKKTVFSIFIIGLLKATQKNTKSESC